MSLSPGEVIMVVVSTDEQRTTLRSVNDEVPTTMVWEYGFDTTDIGDQVGDTYVLTLKQIGRAI